MHRTTSTSTMHGRTALSVVEAGEAAPGCDQVRAGLRRRDVWRVRVRLPSSMSPRKNFGRPWLTADARKTVLTKRPWVEFANP